MPSSTIASKFTKRAHKKSRNGCNTCKLRRVKCDETHPKCKNCSRRGTDCVFAPPKLPSSLSSSASSSSTSSSLSAGSSSSNGSFQNTYFKYVPDSAYPLGNSCEVQLVPPLSFSPTSTSDCSGSSVSSDQFALNQYTNYTFVESPQSFDQNMLSNCLSTFDSPNSIFDDRNIKALGYFETEVSPTMTTDLVDPQLKEKSITLASNNGEQIFPSYLDHTSINNKLLHYFSSQLAERLAPNLEMSKFWSSLSNMGFKYIHLFHMVVSLSSLWLYYDFCETQVEPVLNFDKIDKYLLIEQMNFKEYLGASQIVLTKPISIQEVFSHMAAEILNLLHFLMSPTATVCDPQFFMSTSKLCNVFEELNNSKIDYGAIMSSNELFYYYDPFSVDKLVFDSTSYFPTYLYDLCNWRATDSDFFYDGSYVFEILDNERSRKKEASLAQNPEEELDLVEVLSEANKVLRFAINVLRREYAIVYNNDFPEKDAVRVFARWPSLMPDTFADLLARHDQKALLVVAHYLCLLGSLDFNDLFPRKAIVDDINRIETILEKEWLPWMNVPKRVLGMI